ncbi:MAG TPA: AIPR family protein, partial [Pyrinomonadaceae bacterium]|nr:AIPR family protein [Pyrinomonadaceae bacterium]
RSNDRIQIEIQNAIYNYYGYFYERKRGEYEDGLRAGYIHRPQIIDRDIFIRLCNSCDYKPAEAKRFKHLFKEDNFAETLSNVDRFKEYFFAFKCYERLTQLHSDGKKNSMLELYGYALEHGIYAVVSACMRKYKGDESLKKVGSIVDSILTRWKRFESLVSRRPDNKLYMRSYIDEGSGGVKQFFNFRDYYKGQTLDSDVLRYFKR